MTIRYRFGIVRSLRYRNGRSSLAGDGISPTGARHGGPVPHGALGAHGVVGVLADGDGRERLVGGELVEARLVAEDLVDGAGEPVDQPRLAVVVVHREDAVLGEVVARLGDGLLGEQVRLEPELAGARDEGQRVGQGEEDEVVLLVVARQEGATVVDVDADARVVVGLVRVDLAADLLDPRVDLHRVDVLRALGQGEGDVGAGAGAHDEHAVERVVDGPLVRTAVDRLDLQALLDVQDVLVRDAVDLDASELLGRPHVERLRVDLVVRRPRDAGHQRLEHEHTDDQDHRDPGDPGQGQAVEGPEDDEGDDRPHPRRGAQEGDEGEGQGAEDRADDVPAVGVEGRELAEGPAGDLAEHRHGDGDDDEDERERDPRRQARGAHLGEEDEVARRALDLRREQHDEGDEDQQADRHVARRCRWASASAGSPGRCRGTRPAGSGSRSRRGGPGSRRSSGSGPAGRRA